MEIIFTNHNCIRERFHKELKKIDPKVVFLVLNLILDSLDGFNLLAKVYMNAPYCSLYRCC